MLGSVVFVKLMETKLPLGGTENFPAGQLKQVVCPAE